MLHILNKLKYIAAAIVIAVGLVLPGNTVYASSVYDNVMENTDTLVIGYDGYSDIDITETFVEIMDEECPTGFYEDFAATLADDTGVYSVAQFHHPNGTSDTVSITWNSASSNEGAAGVDWNEVRWSDIGNAQEARVYAGVFSGLYQYVELYMDGSGNPGCFFTADAGGWRNTFFGESISQVFTGRYYNFVTTYSANYPTSYAGESINGTVDDFDGDNLDYIQEAIQYTSDTDVDTDGDGIDDFIESAWYPYRNVTFCDTGVSPYVCAYPEPLAKDLYIEIDWMYDSGEDKLYKPTSTHLDQVVDILSDNEIFTHIDMGEYGGGNQLPVYSSNANFDPTVGHIDLDDYKYGGDSTDTGGPTISAQFDSLRLDIWRYMIVGDTIGDASASTYAQAETLGDDSFIAYGNTEDRDEHYEYSFDRALAGIITHEIGHYLCLSSVQHYAEQDEDCVFADIDQIDADEDYQSVMSVDLALPRIEAWDDIEDLDFSDGTNGVNDHNDWSAIQDGMEAFIYQGEFTAPLEVQNKKLKHDDAKHVKVSKKEKEVRKSLETKMKHDRSKDVVKNKGKNK